jgi:AraC family transcriptional regulator
MEKLQPIAMDAPRFEERTWTFAGLRRRHARAAGVWSAMDEHWCAASARFPAVAGRQGGAGYGLYYDMFAKGEGFEMVAAVAVDQAGKRPPAFERLQVPPRRYAVFGHHGPVSRLRSTIWTAWYGWLPNLGLRSAGDSLTPDFIEVYGDDPANTGGAAIEVWFPIRA